MRRTHGSDEQSMVAFGVSRPYHRRMLHTETPETRTLTVVLPEAEWRALREAEPDALGWLQAQIRHRLGHTEEPPRPEPAPLQEYDDY